MNWSSVKPFLGLFLVFIFGITSSWAQPMLPDLEAISDNGKNYLRWHSPYDGVKLIAVQQSLDSLYNFKTIGQVKNVKRGIHNFVDEEPEAKKVFYRLYLVFNSNFTWYSNTVRAKSDIVREVPSAVNLDSIVSAKLNEDYLKIIESANKNTSIKSFYPLLRIEIPGIETIDPNNYIISRFLSSNPFTGHISVNFPNDVAKQFQGTFTIDFFDINNKKILNIPKISNTSFIIDKRNFQNKGIYKFELKQADSLIESGNVVVY